MKSTPFFILLLAPFAIIAQGVFSNNTNTALQKIIEDYPNKFSNIIGERISNNQPGIDYYSKIEIPGAAACIITHYSTARAEVYCWKTQLFESANFEETKVRYKEYFNNIKNTIVKIEGLPPYILNGKYECPEDKKITTIGFQLLPASGEMQKLLVDLTLRPTSTGWKINLSVHEKDLNNDVVAASD